VIVACLMWYDEPVEQLDRCVRSLGPVADVLVAVDGAFADYPHDGMVNSPPEQFRVIEQACRRDGRIRLVPASTQYPWPDEVSKRAWMVGYAVNLCVPTGDDWLLVIDGDEYVEEAARRLEIWGGLAELKEDVADVTFRFADTEHPLPRLYRAQPGLTVVGAHWRYVVGDRLVCAHGNEPEPPRGDATQLIALRHDPLRSDERQRRRGEFAQVRKQLER
jgi:hypothetical protein